MNYSKYFKHILSLAAAIAVGTMAVHATDIDGDGDDDGHQVDYEVQFTGNAGSGDLAPYYITANRGGTLTQRYSALASAHLWHAIDTTDRFSWGYGVEIWGGYTSSANYDRYDATTGTFTAIGRHPARGWIQQLYAKVKYRGVFLTAGQQEHSSPLLNSRLSSGDLTMSGNARPGMGVTAGFINFQDIPFTKGWVQICGEIGYYRLGDTKWINDHYNYYNSKVTTGYWFNYKNAYFRTKPTERLVFTIGMQAACQFGGDYKLYQAGQCTRTMKMSSSLKSFFHALIPGSGGSGNKGDADYMEGNHVGTWDVMLEYKLPRGHRLRGYYQSPWEDGSGIGKLNGFDGLWGLEWRNGNAKAPVTGVVIEYLDLTNQSGPIHYRPSDYAEDGYESGSPTKGQATGSDDYYNNYAYCGYHSRGLAIGSPMVKSPIYNQDGYLGFTDNLLRGFHLAVSGCAGNDVDYRAMVSYRRSWGTPFRLRTEAVDVTSAMVEAIYRVKRVQGLSMTAQLAIDRGKLYGNNFGGLITVSYRGNFTL